jgi:hypothetical protein
MLLVTAGKMNKQAAGDLGISEITVKNSSGCGYAQNGRTQPSRPCYNGGGSQAQTAVTLNHSTRV